jgi:hypothetical protein
MTKKPFKTKVEIDLTGWDMGAEELAKLITVKRDGAAVTIVFDAEKKFEEITNKLAEEAIETFFEEGFSLCCEKTGVSIVPHGPTEDAISGDSNTVPWDSVWLRPEAGKRIIEWLAKELGAEDEEFEEHRAEIIKAAEKLLAVVKK